MHAVAGAVDDDRIMHAYRQSQLILLDDVDVNTQIEAMAEGQNVVKPLLARAANRKSIEALTKEIRAAEGPKPDAARRYRATLAFLSIPRRYARSPGASCPTLTCSDAFVAPWG
jgi:hypothetical protein